MIDIDTEFLAQLVKSMGFDTVETRDSDSLDFKSVAIWSAVIALHKAHLQGVMDERARVAGITGSQMWTLREYAFSNGRTWKSKLSQDWAKGTASPELMALRNSRTFGPSGLKRIKVG